MEPEWLTHAKRLQAIASTGLHFTHDPYDQERYREVAESATTMLAQLGQVPLERIVGLVSPSAQGYVTPKVDVRAAVIEEGRILLVRESSDGLWSLPGGFADVGLLAAQNVVKEVREEAGVEVVARSLYAVRHKAKQAYAPDAREFYKLFFLCQRLDEAEIKPGVDTSEVGRFLPDALPPLSRGRTVESDIAAAFAQHAIAEPVTLFD